MPDLSHLLDLGRGILAFLVVVPILVTVHELGHFWAARAFGMKVDAFAVMVGGRRATKLDVHLARPLGPTWPIWGLGVLGAGLAYFGRDWASVAGLALVGVAVPLWVSFRLERLYHLGPGTAARTLATAALAGAALLLFATRANAAPLAWAGVFTAACWAGTLVLYYRPVLGKAEDASQGEGRIMTESGPLPVSFRPLWARKDRHGTEFSLLCLPLGGFAAIRGMHPKEDGTETHVDGGFYSKPPWQRWTVLFAGPLFSILFGILLLTAGFVAFGRMMPDADPVLGTVKADGPAAAAGLQEGDRIVSVAGKPVKVFFDIVRATRDRTDEASLTQGLEVRYERGGEARTAVVRPKLDDKAEPVLDEKLMPTQESRKQARLLVGPRISRQPVPFGEALGLAVRQPVELAVGLVSLAGRPERVTEDLGGPATIATQTVEASRQGLSGIVVFAAMLSISFGVFNLLPVSPLDGGQMLVALVELMRGGRRLSFRTQSAVANVSFVLLSILVITVLTADIKRHASPAAPPAQAR